MNKKIMSIVLLFAIVAQIYNSSVVSADSNNYETSYDTSIFEGNPIYLIQEHFDSNFGVDVSKRSNSKISGWDIDYRAGRVISSQEGMKLIDGDNAEKISMSRKFMKVKSGCVVFETAFKLADVLSNGFYYSIGGNIADAIKIYTDNGRVRFASSDETDTVLLDSLTEDFSYLKLEIDVTNHICNIYVNGTEKVVFKINSAISELSSLEIGTSIEDDCYATVMFVDMYANYIINEHFDCTPEGQIPKEWEKFGESITVQRQNGLDYYDCSQLLSIGYLPAYISKTFECGNSVVVEFKVLITDTGTNTYASLENDKKAVLKVKAENGNFLVNDTIVYRGFKSNLWYCFKIKLNLKSGSSEIYINNKSVASNISISDSMVNAIKIGKETGDNGECKFDDIKLYEDEAEYVDYPSKPIKANSEGYEIGVCMYSMWREGTHFGWDMIAPYSETRKPHLGWYTEGSSEVADWENKWLAESGVDYKIYPFVRHDSTAAFPVKSLRRGESFTDGYLNSKYSNDIGFAIMWSGVNEKNLYGLEDFKNNILPYWVEYYFKDPRYKVIDNKPILYIYNIQGVLDVLKNTDEMKRIIGLLNRACLELGYDGITIAASVMSDELSAEFPDIFRWKYNLPTDNYINQINLNESEYDSGFNTVATISPGYDTTPWRTSSAGFINKEDYSKICDYIVEKTAELKDASNLSAGLIYVDCWNEYGEGHFIAPSNLNGFDYLDCIREKFAPNSNPLIHELPSETAYARMNVMYPFGRGGLKIAQDRIAYDETDIADMKVFGNISFDAPDALAGWEKTRCSISYNSVTNSLEGHAEKNDAMIYKDFSSMNIDMSAVDAIRINCYANGGSNVRIFYTTDTDSQFNINKSFYSSIRSDSDYREYILIPQNEEGLIGKLSYLRVDFDDALYKMGANFGIKSIEIIGNHKKYHITIDDERVFLTSKFIKKDNGIFIAAYKLYLSYADVYPVWDLQERTLNLKKNDNLVSFTADSSIYTVNGIEKKCSATPFYNDGNLFIDYRDVLEPFDYDVIYDDINKTIAYNNRALKSYITDEKFPYSWHFDTISTEGWAGSSSKVAKIKTDNGALRISSHTNDPIITKDDVSISAEEYRYMLLRLKNPTSSKQTTVRFVNSEGNRLDYRITSVLGDEYSDYIVKLTDNSAWKDFGLVTSIRIDPCEAIGVTYIDSFEILKKLPTVASSLQVYNYVWGDNLVPVTDNSNIGYYKFSNVKDYTSTSMPLDGDSVVVIPSDRTKDTLFGIQKIIYNDKKLQSINKLCEDKRIVRVEFDYKPINGLSEFIFENRKASNDITQKVTEPVNAGSDGWGKFSIIYNMSEFSYSDDNSRWFIIRVKKNDVGSGMYVKNFRVSYAVENSADGKINGDSVIIRSVVKNDTSKAVVLPQIMLISESTDGILATIKTLEIIRELDAGEVDENVVLYKLSKCDALNVFLWKDMGSIEPIAEPVRLVR